MTMGLHHVDTLVIGAGGAGLAVGYHLARHNVPFVIVDTGHRVGDGWRKRRNPLRLLTPARDDGLDGLAFPGPPDHYPTRDEMADYLEHYAAHFDLPLRLGFEVDRLARRGSGFVAASGDRVVDANNVVVALGNEQKPRIPPFSAELDPAITQIHSSAYRHPSQIPPGDVLIVGADSSGAEISLDLVGEHRVWLSGRHLRHRPAEMESLTGRRVRPRHDHGKPLARTQPEDLARSGVEPVGRTAGVRDGKPLLDDGRMLDVHTVVWATGSHPGLTWIDREILAGDDPGHDLGVGEVPGLYFVGLVLPALSSAQIRGVRRDAAQVAAAIAARKRATTTSSLQRNRP